MKAKLRIAIISCVRFGQVLLEELASMTTVEICGIVTRKNSHYNADFCDLSLTPGMEEVPVYWAAGVDQIAMESWLQQISPDVIFCLGWSYLLKREILSIAPHGVVGYHPALLPRNRGRHPIIWALALGLRETGSTFFLMDEGADSGPILSQKSVKIDDEDNASTLYTKLELVAKAQMRQLVEEFRVDLARPCPQDHSLATSWRKRTKSDGKIDWRMRAESIHNLVRALSPPYPGAYFEYDAREVRVWKTRLGGNSLLDIEPGYILSSNQTMVNIQCGMGTCIILEDYDMDLPLLAGRYL
jgi:methionyl-tRNA formyltransferase